MRDDDMDIEALPASVSFRFVRSSKPLEVVIFDIYNIYITYKYYYINILWIYYKYIINININKYKYKYYKYYLYIIYIKYITFDIETRTNAHTYSHQSNSESSELCLLPSSSVCSHHAILHLYKSLHNLSPDHIAQRDSIKIDVIKALHSSFTWIQLRHLESHTTCNWLVLRVHPLYWHHVNVMTFNQSATSFKSAKLNILVMSFSQSAWMLTTNADACIDK